jgi:hypothetical protein
MQEQPKSFAYYVKAPFRWLQEVFLKPKDSTSPSPGGGIFGKVRGFVQRNPYTSLTLFFLGSLALTLFSGLWWLGGAVFLVGFVTFVGNDFLSNTLKLSALTFEILIAAIVVFMFIALVTPIPNYFILYLLAPLALLIAKSCYDFISMTTIYREMVQFEESMGKTLDPTADNLYSLN